MSFFAEETGIALATLQSLAARAGYNTRLSTIEKICRALKCSPGDLLEMSTSYREHDAAK